MSEPSDIAETPLGTFRVANSAEVIEPSVVLMWDTAVAKRLPSDGVTYDQVHFVRLCDDAGQELGVLRRRNTTRNADDTVYLSADAALRHPVLPGATVHAAVADLSAFRRHRRHMLRSERALLVGSTVLVVLGGLIQLAWDIGDRKVLIPVGAGWAWTADIVKYLLVVVGVAGINLYQAYPRD
jgi:hypothetical protein